MEEPVITYSAKLHDTDSYADTYEIYGGTYTESSPIAIDVRIWNNKYGTEVVTDLKDFAINFSFQNYEDACLLDYLKVTYNGTTEMNIDIVDGVATGVFIDDIVLSGAVNNGSDSDTENFIDLLIEFDAKDICSKLKNLDFKSLYMEIIQQ